MDEKKLKTMGHANYSVRRRLANTCWLVIQRILPAKVYLSLRYRLLFGRWINWKNPKTFTEKLQWLKVYHYGIKESCLVDKILVKDYVAARLGEGYVLPTLGIWNKAEDISFESLPKEYVLKCNHDSGSIFFSKGDEPINHQKAREKLTKTLKTNYYWTGCETPYRFVKPQIFAEPLMKSSASGGLRDYKFFCFNGEPKMFKIDFNRFIDHHANYYDVEGNLLPFGEIAPPPSFEKRIIIPSNLSMMVDIARKLSQGLPFARIDLYNVDERIVFGEITLFPTSGFGRFTDDEWDLRLGSWLTLPSKVN